MTDDQRRMLLRRGYSEAQLDQWDAHFMACRAAGLDDSEIGFDPQHGIVVTESGARKLAASVGKDAGRAMLDVHRLWHHEGTRQ
jgi:hypothetical protein